MHIHFPCSKSEWALDGLLMSLAPKPRAEQRAWAFELRNSGNTFWILNCDDVRLFDDVCARSLVRSPDLLLYACRTRNTIFGKPSIQRNSSIWNLDFRRPSCIECIYGQYQVSTNDSISIGKGKSTKIKCPRVCQQQLLIVEKLPREVLHSGEFSWILYVY